jgi:hypothetical protein
MRGPHRWPIASKETFAQRPLNRLLPPGLPSKQNRVDSEITGPHTGYENGAPGRRSSFDARTSREMLSFKAPPIRLALEVDQAAIHNKCYAKK